MSKIGHLQNCLEDIFDEFTPKFVNKMHWIQLEYHVEGHKQILVFVRVYKKESQKETLKSTMYVVKWRTWIFCGHIWQGCQLPLQHRNGERECTCPD